MTRAAPAHLAHALDLPFARTDAERAAVQIVTLVRRGDALATSDASSPSTGTRPCFLGASWH